VVALNARMSRAQDPARRIVSEGKARRTCRTGENPEARTKPLPELLSFSSTPCAILPVQPARANPSMKRTRVPLRCVLSLVLSEYCFGLLDFSEGRLTRLRSALSNRIALLAPWRRSSSWPGSSESARRAPRLRPARRSILADACEALIGAIYSTSASLRRPSSTGRGERSLRGCRAGRAGCSIRRGGSRNCSRSGTSASRCTGWSARPGQAHEMDFEVTGRIRRHALGSAAAGARSSRERAARPLWSDWRTGARAWTPHASRASSNP